MATSPLRRDMWPSVISDMNLPLIAHSYCSEKSSDVTSMKRLLETAHTLPSPCYLIDEDRLEQNLRILDSVQQKTGADILLALKGFSAFTVFPRVRNYLKGVSASSLNEARLGKEEFGKQVHLYAPAYKDDEFPALLKLADHVNFNSFRQWKRFRERAMKHADRIRYGLRINPEYSDVATDLYNPCKPGSRFGITIDTFKDEDLTGITGLHFHTLCEQNADALAHTLEVVETKFAHILEGMEWINMGGGHHITRADYDLNGLCGCIESFCKRYPLKVYLEPGEAIALNTGFLVSTVLDVIYNEMDIAILDTSATAHMPDVLEMPYRPTIIGGDQPGAKAHTYRLAGLTCLAGDVIGDYSFDAPLAPGDRIIFTDMAHYTMVKNTTFNGIALPAIALNSPKEGVRVVREFGYNDYRDRLG